MMSCVARNHSRYGGCSYFQVIVVYERWIQVPRQSRKVYRNARNRDWELCADESHPSRVRIESEYRITALETVKTVWQNTGVRNLRPHERESARLIYTNAAAGRVTHHPRVIPLGCWAFRISPVQTHAKFSRPPPTPSRSTPSAPVRRGRIRCRPGHLPPGGPWSAATMNSEKRCVPP